MEVLETLVAHELHTARVHLDKMAVFDRNYCFSSDVNYSGYQ